MTLTVHTDLVQGSDEWHDVRRGIVTASTVGNLITTRRLAALDYDCPDCGAPSNDPCRSKVKQGAVIKTLHPERAEVARRSPSPLIFETASNDLSRSLTLMLTAERITGWTEPTFMNDAMARGVADEPVARGIYSEHYAPVTEVGFMIEDKWGFPLGYSPDGLVGETGLIEIKSRAPKAQLATVLAGHPPAENMAQLQAGLLVSGREWLDYISFAGGMHMFVKRIYPDPRWFEAIINAVRAFENNAREMIAIYQDAVAGLQPTERTLELGLVI
jgi:hypothetical protein